MTFPVPIPIINSAMAHEHAHFDDRLLSTDRGIRALKVSIIGLGLTAAFQAVIAIVGGSAGLLADTLHNGSETWCVKRDA